MDDYERISQRIDKLEERLEKIEGIMRKLSRQSYWSEFEW